MGAIEFNTTSSLDNVQQYAKRAAVWGNVFASGACSAYYVSRSTAAIATAIQALPRSQAFDPLVYTLGVPSLFGLIGTVMIPLHLYGCYSALTSSEAWKTRAVSFVKSLGGLGLGLGGTAQTVIFLWNETQKHMLWLPGFQIISGIVAGSDVVMSIIHLNKLKQLDAGLEKIDDLWSVKKTGQKIFTKESAEKYLGIPQVRFEEFKKAMKNEPDQGLSILKARVKAKITEQKLRIAAGVISILALGVLAAIAFAPTPIAPVALTILTIAAYTFSASSSILNIVALWKNFHLLDPSYGCSKPEKNNAAFVFPVINTARFARVTAVA